MTKLAFFGAGGKMGRMISKKLSDSGEFDLRCVEIAEEGIKALEDVGLSVIPAEEAVADVDVVVFAVPDADVLNIAHEIACETFGDQFIVERRIERSQVSRIRFTRIALGRMRFD